MLHTVLTAPPRLSDVRLANALICIYFLTNEILETLYCTYIKRLPSCYVMGCDLLMVFCVRRNSDGVTVNRGAEYRLGIKNSRLATSLSLYLRTDRR